MNAFRLGPLTMCSTTVLYISQFQLRASPQTYPGHSTLDNLPVGTEMIYLFILICLSLLPSPGVCALFWISILAKMWGSLYSAHVYRSQLYLQLLHAVSRLSHVIGVAAYPLGQVCTCTSMLNKPNMLLSGMPTYYHLLIRLFCPDRFDSTVEPR